MLLGLPVVVRQVPAERPGRLTLALRGLPDDPWPTTLDAYGVDRDEFTAVFRDIAVPVLQPLAAAS